MTITMDTIFHNGEKLVQPMTGELIKASAVGRIVKDSVEQGVINFIEHDTIICDRKILLEPFHG